jgi:hypothetical protein
MYDPNEYNYQGRLKRALNLLIFSLVGISLSFASIYLLTRYHFARNDISSTEVEIQKIPKEIEETIISPFHFHEHPENFFYDYSKDTLPELNDFSNKEEDTTHSEFRFSWPELPPGQRE